MKIIENNYKEMSFKGQIEDKIYHGCTTRYANGKRKLIYFKKWKRRLCLRPNPFQDSQTPVVLACRQETHQKKTFDCWIV